MAEHTLKPDMIFETSWEVCNKVGGIYTVISTKAMSIMDEVGGNLIFIGPDVWRDESKNPEFIEDPELYRQWKEVAAHEGLYTRIGRWNIIGNPIVIIVDFTSFINSKDEVFSQFWESHKLDSLSGQWDYIEPALFGYAAGKVIESFVKYNLGTHENVIAHFHEWLTGTGILYLNKSMPQVGTVFTTHATVLGRSLAGNNKPLYKNLNNFNADTVAREFNVVSKQSLESLSAQNSDAFATVSQITARECSHFLQKGVDVVTVNGFDDSFVPGPAEFDRKRKEARKKMLAVAQKLMGYTIDSNALLVATSGRYEFKNKGIDLFLESLGALNNESNLGKQIVAFMLVPAHHYGPRTELLENMSGESKIEMSNKCYTHNIHDAEFDPILNKLKLLGLNNGENDRVKVIFVPSFLNGDDGIFDLQYYDLLIGLDLTVFASYYEPWGYTPLESIAFKVPTITTSLAGIGAWVIAEFPNTGNGANVIRRTDDNDAEVVSEIKNTISVFTHLRESDVETAREKAYAISRTALWKNLVHNYWSVYNIALQKVGERIDLFKGVEQTKQEMTLLKRAPINEPVWNEFLVKSNLTKKLARLDELSRNLWWSWNAEAIDLFSYIDPKLWEQFECNPIHLIENVSLDRFVQLENDKGFMQKMSEVLAEFDGYMGAGVSSELPKVSYFSMEFGLHTSLKIYSGGLGILAGDYLKQASDQQLDLVAVGLLYKYGYFKQKLTVNGEQQAVYEPQVVSHLPIEKVMDYNGNWLCVQIVLPGRIMTARLWKVKVGRIPLYLLDTDFEANQTHDRFVTHHLYGGDNENRLKQELLLGIGGIRALEAVGVKTDVYHSNEGHSAFIGLERLRVLIRDHNLSFEVAKEVVRSSTLFTTHTPVPAGHDYFQEDLLRVYLAHYPERLKISWDELVGLGRFNPFDKNEKFSMSVLAAKLSQEMNGVSYLHGKVSQEMFAGLYKGYLPEENHIGHVTNGVHLDTWTAKEWKDVYQEQFGPGFRMHQSEESHWKKIYDVPDEKVWEIKQKLKRKLYSHIRERFQSGLYNRHEKPREVVDILERFNENALTIGFARRFATYKRAQLLFRNPEKLAQIINDPDKPVQFIFAGKAHPQDTGGQKLIKNITEVAKMPEFKGKIIFLQNYDMELAKKLVAGVDIWLNTPTRPLEASGTSGEKAAMNGTMHFSVLDGWWVEGYKPGAGWALPMEKAFDNQEFQDDLDSETIYQMLEDEIVPLYYDFDKNGVPRHWVQYVKKTIAEVAPHFTMKRMVDDYIDRYYGKLASRYHALLDGDFKQAKDIALWKKMIAKHWEEIEVVSISMPESLKKELILGEKYFGEVALNLKGLLPEEVGLEWVVIHVSDKQEKLLHKQEFNFAKKMDGQSIYKLSYTPTHPGAFKFGIRIFPKNKFLPHRQDLSLVKWI
jgi:glycogen phosphorylase/synthase